MTKTERQVELIKLLAKEPWCHHRKSLAQILQTSEASIQRDLDELCEKGYRFVQNESHQLFILQSGWFGQMPLKDSTLRQVEILQLLYRRRLSLTVTEIARHLTLQTREDVGEKTIERDVKALYSKGLVTREGNSYALNLAQILPPIELSEHEKRVFYESLKLAKALSPLPDQIPAIEAKLKLKLPLEERRETLYVHGRMPTQDIRGTQYCNALEKAALELRVISILYRKEESPAKEYRLKPLGVVYYWALDKWYLVADYEGEVRTFAVDNILHMEFEEEIFPRIEGFNLQEYFKYS